MKDDIYCMKIIFKGKDPRNYFKNKDTARHESKHLQSQHLGS